MVEIKTEFMKNSTIEMSYITMAHTFKLNGHAMVASSVCESGDISISVFNKKEEVVATTAIACKQYSADETARLAIEELVSGNYDNWFINIKRFSELDNKVKGYT